MTGKKFLRSGVFGSAALLMFSSTLAMAQNAPDSSGAMEEIIVTAQFREQSLQDTPIAITAVSSALLEARGQTDISQVAVQAPSVTLKPQGAAYGPALSANIRGIGQYDFNPALEPGVGMYVDDVYYATLTGSILDLLDLDRVEILRGPQGTLAGRNSIGGAVKIYSKRPQGDNSGMVSATYGSRNRLDLRAMVDFALHETLAMRISGVAKKQEGYVKRMDFGCVNPPGSPLNPSGPHATPIPPSTALEGDCVVARESDVGTQAVRGQLLWQPTDNLDINLIGDYTYEDRNVAGSVLLDRAKNGVRASPNFDGYNRAAGAVDVDPFTPNMPDGSVNPDNIPLDVRFVCGPYCNYSTFQAPPDGNQEGYATNGRLKFKGWGVSGQVDYTINDDLKLTSITAFRKYTAIITNDDDLTPLAMNLNGGPLTFRFFSQELRLNGALLDDTINYTLGGYYSDQESVYAARTNIRYGGLPAFYQDDPVKANTKAAFLHVTWNPIEPLTLIGGLRYTDDFKSYTYVRVPPSGNGPLPILGPLNGVTGVYDGPQSRRFDYRAGVQYAVTPDVNIYAQVATGYKGGGINPRPFFAEQVQSFGPEKLTSWEAGVKSELFDNRMRLNATAFFSKYSDIQLSLLSCPEFNPTPPGPGVPGLPCALPANIGDADIKGFELETSIRPIAGMSIDGALSYIDFEYKSLAGATAIQMDFVTPYTPKWKWSFGAQYEVLLGQGAGSVTPRVEASYQGMIYGNPDNQLTNRMDAYTIANARITWRNEEGDLQIMGEVTNLFDKYHLLTIFDITGAGGGTATGQPGRPREFAISVKKNF